MKAASAIGFASLLALALAGCILVDSWFEGDVRVAPDGEGPVLNHEIAGKGASVELEVETPAYVPVSLDVPELGVDLTPSTAPADPPPLPRPVDPSGWLGRRHFRSPA